MPLPSVTPESSVYRIGMQSSDRCGLETAFAESTDDVLGRDENAPDLVES
jgi:hypothetical protein